MRVFGPISETKARHLERHGGGRQACPRCRYYQMGERWARACGHMDESLLCAAGPRGTVWLAEKPAPWGGVWGLGCNICADSAARAASGQAEELGGRHGRRWGTAWARFDVRPATMQAEHVRQHSDYNVHRIAVLAWLRSDVPVQLSLQQKRWATIGS